MAKNKFGKFLAFTTTVAAIGGACYIFRDKIKESSVYQKAKDTLDNLFDKEDDYDDFIFDDDDFDDDEVFSAKEKGNREYTSITITAKEDDSTVSDDNNESDAATTNINTEETNTESPVVETATDSIMDDAVVVNPSVTFESQTKNDATVDAYENEGLSDVYEDPDSLEEQDKLDF